MPHLTNERCPWAKHPLEIDYHDHVWGRPEFDDLKLFKMLILEGMQAGLSWLTVLKKMENFSLAFDDFAPEILAAYDQDKIDSLMENRGIIRNRLKIKATVQNAKAYLALTKTQSFSDFLWGYVNHSPIVNKFSSPEDVPALTPLSMQLSKDLKKLGFNFVGPTIVYAFMQAVGMVNDHVTYCPFHSI